MKIIDFLIRKSLIYYPTVLFYYHLLFSLIKSFFKEILDFFFFFTFTYLIQKLSWVDYFKSTIILFLYLNHKFKLSISKIYVIIHSSFKRHFEICFYNIFFYYPYLPALKSTGQHIFMCLVYIK